MGDQINCLIFYIPSNKLFYSVINFYICSSCSTLTFSGILSLLGSFIFNYKFPLNLTISYNFLLSLASSFLASMCVPSSRQILLLPTNESPHPFGTSFSSAIILILEHFPRVANKSNCLGMISYAVIMNASGLI